MLGKLFKHQMKSVSKVLIIIHAALLLLGLFLGITAPNFAESSEFFNAYEFIFVFAMVLYIFLLAGVLMATYILLGIRFYRNMFTDEGYLTHTLPVKTGTLMFSHILTFTVWYVISMIVMFLSIALLVIGAGGGSELFELISYLPEVYNTSMPVLILAVAQYLIVGAISAATMIYLSTCIGNLFAPHKVIASIVSYIILYIIVMIVSMIFMICSPALKDMMFSSTSYVYLPTEFIQTMWQTELLTIILAAVFWISSHIILKKHLNME